MEVEVEGAGAVRLLSIFSEEEREPRTDAGGECRLGGSEVLAPEEDSTSLDQSSSVYVALLLAFSSAVEAGAYL